MSINVRFYVFIFTCMLALAGCALAGGVNQLSEQEEKEGFKLLFDGR